MSGARGWGKPLDFEAFLLDCLADCNQGGGLARATDSLQHIDLVTVAENLLYRFALALGQMFVVKRAARFVSRKRSVRSPVNDQDQVFSGVLSLTRAGGLHLPRSLLCEVNGFCLATARIRLV